MVRRHVPAPIRLQLVMSLSIITLKQIRVKMTHDRFWSNLNPKGFYEINIILDIQSQRTADVVTTGSRQQEHMQNFEHQIRHAAPSI